MMERIAQQAAKDARDVFSDDRQAQTAISCMEQLVYAALRNVEYDLTDPVAVHANMLRGTIAKPTVEQIIHLYGVDALTKALAPVIVREAGIEPVAAPDPALRPTMTDMMVDPDMLDAFMEANPLPPDPAAIREAAIREALDALGGTDLFGRTAAEKHVALEQYCRGRDAILALIEQQTPAPQGRGIPGGLHVPRDLPMEEE